MVSSSLMSCHWHWWLWFERSGTLSRCNESSEGGRLAAGVRAPFDTMPSVVSRVAYRMRFVMVCVMVSPLAFVVVEQKSEKDSWNNKTKNERGGVQKTIAIGRELPTNSLAFISSQSLSKLLPRGSRIQFALFMRPIRGDILSCSSDVMTSFHVSFELRRASFLFRKMSVRLVAKTHYVVESSRVQIQARRLTKRHYCLWRKEA